ncbi:MAG TPA: hypothetical protein VFZ91_02260 [Allosphingosinicella sp.]
MGIGQELLSVPFPEMVRNLGVGIAEAQFQLDLVSLKIARMMAGYEVPEERDDGAPPLPGEDSAERKYLVEFNDGSKYSLLELGFTPTFYQFVDTVIELKMSISMSRSVETSQKSSRVSAAGGAFLFAAAATVSSVSASFASKYQYSAEGSSVMRTKLVPIPPPAVLEQRIRLMIEKTTPAPAPGGGGGGA